MKKKETSRFSHLAKELEDFKAGKTKLKVTTLGDEGKTVHYETYEEMRDRHESKVRAAADFKALRKEIGLSQQMLARALRVAPRTLEGWESGRFAINPSAEVLARVMKEHPEIKRELAGA